MELCCRGSVAEAPLLRAGAPAVCNASTEVGGTEPARLTELATEPRLSLHPSSQENHEKKIVIKQEEAEKERHKVTTL